MAAEELGPLPAGRHGYSREQVAHHQRERLIAGLASAVAVKGYGAVVLADITREAKVSRRVFYENFGGKEQCFLAAFEVVVDHLRELIEEAVAPIPDWPHQAIAATRATLAFFATEPDLARLCLVESRGAGPAVTASFNEAAAEIVPALRRGRAERSAGERPLPDSTEETTIGSVISLAYRKVVAGEAKQLEQLLPDCAEFVLAPYLGSAEAARLARAAA
ncbi:MAG TPA: TetR/AcrR family transcriptional regulator [Solirubrobacterales bacterium]|jgi:AcrR family transcriptional regulator|nr:TetR/AcrR family transcriptional regulator [Solirubrobacterales bacterium]